MIGKNPKGELEGKRDLLYTKLKELDKNRGKLESEIETLVEKISREERKITLPKMYYRPLEKFLTADEIVEFDCFFGKVPPEISTDLTSIC